MNRRDFFVVNEERGIALHPGSGELVYLNTIPEGDFDDDVVDLTRFRGYDDDEFEGDDDEFEGDDDEFEGDDDEFEGENDADFGARRKKKKGKKKGRRKGKEAKSTSKGGSSMNDWPIAIENGSSTLGAAGTATVTIRVQDDFIVDDIAFEGSLAGAKITEVKMGNTTIFSNSTGLPITLFATTSNLRRTFKNHRVQGGRDIRVVGTLTGAGDLAVQFIGRRRP